MAWLIPRVDLFPRLFILHVLCFQSVLGNWSLWGEWSDGSCSVTCGEGNRVVTRTRFCNNPDNECVGDNVDKRTTPCQQQESCGELTCYECNIFRNGKITPCKDWVVQRSCRACLKSYTKIRLHDRVGYTRDSIVESRLCVTHEDFNTETEEGCKYKTSNGGYTALCHCFSDRCNSGVRQGPQLSLFFLTGLFWILRGSDYLHCK